jgi:hypothetical protein
MIKILNKINNAKILINIVILILIYYFSFHIYPRLGFYNKLEYKGIKTEASSFYHIIDFNYFDNQKDNIIKFSDEPKFLKNQDLFLKQYLYYFTQNKDLVSNAPCPKELLENDLRNIQIYNDKNFDFYQNDLKFNVRFSFYKFFSSSKKLNINKCFDFIFKENLNKYFIIFYRDTIIKKLRIDTDYLEEFKLDYSEIKFHILANERKIEKLKNYNFFIDPNVNYLPEQPEDKSWHKIIAFTICLLILIFTNILYQKLNRNQISKFINRFMNT